MAKGEVIGTLDVVLGDEVLETVDLVAADAVPRANWIQLLGRVVINFISTIK